MESKENSVIAGILKFDLSTVELSSISTVIFPLKIESCFGRSLSFSSLFFGTRIEIDESTAE